MKDAQIYEDATMVGSREEAQDFLSDLARRRQKKNPSETLKECRECEKGRLAYYAFTRGPEVADIVKDFYGVEHPYIPRESKPRASKADVKAFAEI